MAQWEQEEVFPGLWEELLAMNADDVCKRAQASYLEEDESYVIPLLDQAFRVNPAQKTVLPDGNLDTESFTHPGASFIESLILIVYLIKAANVPLAGKMVTEKELPGGELFFRGPHELARKPVLSRYGKDVDGFIRAGLFLGGKKTSQGDACIHLKALPRVPMEYVLWGEDDEFPASLTILFDASAGEHLPLDTLWALVHFVTLRLTEADSSSSILKDMPNK